MKNKRCLLLALVLVVLGSVQVQAQQVQKGDLLVNAGLGFGYYYAGGVSLNVNGEYSVTDEIGVGPYLAYTTWRHNYVGYRYNYSFIDVGVRGSYHLADVFGVNDNKFDPYAGAFIGFVTSSYNYDGPRNPYYDDRYDGGVRAGIHLGGRYYFADNFAAYGELGIGLSPLVLGVTFKP